MRLRYAFALAVSMTTAIASSQLGAREPHGERSAESGEIAHASSERAPIPVPVVTPSRPLRPSLRLAVLSDLNSAYGSLTYVPRVHAATKTLIDEVRPDLVLITGDMVAGQKSGLDYPAMWAAFHRTVTTPLLAAGIPVAPTPGNHDASPAPAFRAERNEYVAQWVGVERVPKVSFIDRSGYPIRYTFEYKGAFFASLDAASVGPLGRSQIDWLSNQLTSAHHALKFVFGHLPVRSFATGRETEILGDDRLVALLEEHSVTAYVSGHHHAYYPGALGKVRHLAMPCLGAGARRLVGEAKTSPAGIVVMEVEDGEITFLEALRSPDFSAFIERRTLPDFVGHGPHTVFRDDIAGLHPVPGDGPAPWPLFARASTRCSDLGRCLALSPLSPPEWKAASP